MSQIKVSDLTFYYEGCYDNIFESVNFEIDTNWKLGFIGRNGRGKTTFLNLLMGRFKYQGTINTQVTFDYFPFNLEKEDYSLLTIEIIEMINSKYELWKVCKELSLLQVNEEVLYRPFITLSNGEQTKVMLAVLFTKDNNFLLIDEPTNHLDMETRIAVKDYLSKKSGFILVSHDRRFLDDCIDHVLVINKKDITVAKGNFSVWWDNKKMEDEYELAQNKKLKKDIKRLSEAAKRNEIWSDKVERSKIGNHVGDRGAVGHKAAKMMKRAKSVERRVQCAIDEKSSLLKNYESVSNLKIRPLKHHKNVLIRAKGLSIYYDKKEVVKDINFDIRNGECVVLQGKNGCGKSSILKKILGENIVSTGLLELANDMITSYVPQDTSFLKGTLKDYIQQSYIDESLFKTLLRKLGFERLQFEKNMEDYSEGQKKKALIAKSLCEEAHLYIWDEPLNFIDFFSRIQIEDLIKQFKPTILMVEHDIVFVETVSDRVVRL